MSNGLETAVLGGGCFWCLEAVFNDVRGVDEVVSGYAGGHTPDPDYRSVCTGRTGHAEVVRVRFDPAVIDYGTILDVFFTIHDPTQKDRQGNDVGTQYRSVIFCANADQERIARARIAELTDEAVFPAPIVTEIAGNEPFHPAEDYHQRYFDENERQPYCQVIIAPKLARFRERFASLRR